MESLVTLEEKIKKLAKVLWEIIDNDLDPSSERFWHYRDEINEILRSDEDGGHV